METSSHPNQTSETKDAALLTRRGFLRGLATAVGTGFSLELLPKVEGGVLTPVFDALGPSTAYGETVFHDEQTYSFTVVSQNQVGICVVDVSKDTPVPVPDATVTLTSRYNQNTATGTTGPDGKVILEIDDLAVEDSSGSDGRLMHFNGTLSVKGPNSRINQMRDFSTGKIYVEGASGIRVNTHAVDNMTAYPERITFDEWDTHYSVNEFFRSSANDESHEILIRLANAYDGVTVTLKSLTTPNWPTGGDGYTAQAQFDTSTSLATASFRAPFLKTGDPACLTGDQNTLRFTYTVNGVEYYSDITIKLYDAPLQRADDSALLFPLSRASSGISLTWPTKAPFFSKLSFSVWTPRIPVTVQFTPLNLLLGIGCDAILADTDKGFQDVNGWRRNPTDYFSNSFDKAFKNKLYEMEGVIKRGSFINTKTGTLEKHVFSKKLEANVAIEAVLNLDWSGMESIKGITYKTFRGKLTGGIDLSLGLTFTEQFMAGPVPFYVSLAFNLLSQLAFVMAAECNTPEDSYELPVEKTAFALSTTDPLVFNINFSVTLSAGVGVSGLVALTISGSPSLSLYLGLLDTAFVTGDNKKWPHTIVGYAFKAEIMFQLVIFKYSATIWSTADNHWYDNWREDADGAESDEALWGEGEARFMFTQADGSLRHSASFGSVEELMDGSPSYDDFMLVTDAELGCSAEFNAKEVMPDDSLQHPVPKVLANKMLWPVRGEGGDVSMELVDHEGANVFVFEEGLEESSDEALVAEGDGAELEGLEPAADPEAGAVYAQVDDGQLLCDPVLGTAASLARSSIAEYEYEYIGTAAEQDVAPGVMGIAPHGGIAVSDQKTATGVFSDPRLRYVTIEGVIYLLRILTVSYQRATDTVNRTRLSATPYDEDSGSWGVPKVFEYGSDNPTLPRVDIFDYDFDIAVKPDDVTWPKGASACIVVSGGMRPYGDQSKICDVFANPTITVLFIDGSLNVVLRSVRRVVDVYDDGMAHMVTCPRVVDRFGINKFSGVLAVSYIHRSVPVADLTNIMAAPAFFPVGVCSVSSDKASLVVNNTPEYPLDAAVQSMDMVLGDPVEGQYDALLTFLFRSQGGYDVYSARIPYQGLFSDMVVVRNVHSSNILPGVKPWQGHGSFLLTHQSTVDETDPHLYEGTYDLGVEDAAGLTENAVDLEGFGGGAFGLSPSGSYLFFIDSRVGDGPVIDVDPDTGEPIKEKDNIYRIKASKFIDGAFCPEFSFCELSHPIDSLEPMSFTRKASTFIASQITNADTSQADLFFITVPHSLAAEVTGIGMLDDFACAGKPCLFQVMLQNHGNVVISGFDLVMCDVRNGYQEVSRVHVGKIEPQNVIITSRTCANPLVSQGIAEQSEENEPRIRDSLAAGQFMPGAPLAYAVSFDIPSDWSGDKLICVRIANAWASETDMQANTGELYTCFNDGVEHTLTIKEYVAVGDAVDPNEGLIEPGSGDKGSGGSSSGIQTSGSVGKQRLPQTGDLGSGMGALSLGMGVLGAGLVAYGRRRQQVERERQEGEEQ